MEPIQYCRDKAAPTGSSLHYALLFTTPPVRDGLLALHALRAELIDIPIECSDAGVAAVKLNWWREEMQRVFAAEARHPVGRVLQQTIERFALPREGFDEMLTATNMDLEYGVYPSFRELSLYCHRGACSLAQLAVQVCGYRDPQTVRYAHDLGMGLELIRLLRHLPQHAAAGRFYLPENEMRQAGVERHELRENTTSKPVRALLGEQAERAKQFLDNAFERLPNSERRRQTPGVVMGTLYRSLLDEMAADDFPLLERRYHLTPLRKLWLAWRSARQARRAEASG